MNETQKRIKAYKAALPDLKERVMAMALMLVMSMAMMTSATFAWLTISRAPELTNVATTLASNGNLEIALVPVDGAKPADSKVGDTNLPIVERNLTWGNLVNLSDASYGLENLTLRPAQLNTSALADSPLYAATYGQDGRIIRLSSNFDYTAWIPPQGEVPGYFGVSTNYGVRAVSSTQAVAEMGFASAAIKKQQAATDANQQAGTAFQNIAGNKTYMEGLAKMMGIHMTATLNRTQTDSAAQKFRYPTVESKYVDQLLAMYQDFAKAFDLEAQAMAEALNLQLFMKYAGDETQYSTYTKAMVLDKSYTTNASLAAQGLQLTQLDQFRKDYDLILSEIPVLEAIKKEAESSGTIGWLTKIAYDAEDTSKTRCLSDVVNALVNINECTLEGTKIGVIASDLSNATGFAGAKKQKAIITNGVMYNFASRTGSNISVGPEYNGGDGLMLEATVFRRGFSVPAEIYAFIYTEGASPSYFQQDYDFANDQLEEGAIAVEYVAMDTYGMVIDLWVRTNAKGTYLALEGNILTEQEEKRATGLDANGKEVELWTVEITTEEGGSYDMELYKDSEGNWIRANSHVVVDLTLYGEGLIPIPKIVVVETVTGYEGADRIWDDRDKGDFQGVDPTTQGSGSCYIYYADTPDEQAKSLELMKAMKVAFISESGTLMATASMDTEHHFADSGRVIVPLVLDSSRSVNLGTDVNGKDILAITELEQNVPLRVTALIYLDGSVLYNKDVMAASDIQGQLNIQFGTTDSMDPGKNEPLYNAVRSIKAEVDKTSFDMDDGTDMTANVTITVDGDQPSTVKAFFIRQINASQGSREEVMEFTQTEDGVWTASYTFTSPGVYTLRSVQIDGVDTALKINTDAGETFPVVTIEGFGIRSLSVDGFTGRSLTLMTAAGSYKTNATLEFATNDESKMPKKVQGRFINEDGNTVNIEFTKKRGNDGTVIWTGPVSFGSSGVYKLQYLVLDGEFVELDESLWHTADLTLGMKVAIETTGNIKFTYKPGQMAENEENLPVKVVIMDNNGDPLLALNNVILNYGTVRNGMTTQLTWDAAQKCYTGVMAVTGPGVFAFREVKVGENTITRATKSPTYTIMSPEPPAFYYNTTAASQFVPNSNPVMKLQLTNATAATCWAHIVPGKNMSYDDGYTADGSLVGIWVEGSRNDNYSTNPNGEPVTDFTFNLTGDYNKDGYYTITEVKLSNVFDKAGTEYTDESPMYLTNFDAITTKVVKNVRAVISADKSQNFGWTDGKLTGTFLQEYTISGLSLQLLDFENQPLPNVTDVKYEFVYNCDAINTPKWDSKNLVAGGQYSGPTNADADFAIALTQSATDATVFTQAQDAKIIYAGSYNTKLSYTVDGVYYSRSGTNLPANAPKFTVSSQSPTVKITGTNPAPGTVRRVYTVPKPDSAATYAIAGDYFRYSDYFAAVYLWTPLKDGTLDQEGAEAYSPKVTLTASGLPATGISDMTMVFTTANEESLSSTFSFGADMKATAEIGKAVQGVRGSYGITDYPELYPAGKMTQNQVTLTYNGISFTVKLSNEIIINNPQSPPYVDYKITHSAFNGTVPEKVYSEDGETITVTLPKLATWTEDKSTTKNADFAQKGEPTTRNVYTERYTTSGSGCNTKYTYYYQPYIETTTIYEASSSTTSWTNTMEITGWKVGNVVYKPGETVTVTGTQTITAVITTTEGPKTVEASTTVRTVITYAKNGAEVTTKPSGHTKVDSAAGSTTDEVIQN